MNIEQMIDLEDWLADGLETEIDHVARESVRTYQDFSQFQEWLKQRSDEKNGKVLILDQKARLRVEAVWQKIFRETYSPRAVSLGETLDKDFPEGNASGKPHHLAFIVLKNFYPFHLCLRTGIYALFRRNETIGNRGKLKKPIASGPGRTAQEP